MDMLMLDVTDVPEAQAGDSVLIFGREGEHSGNGGRRDSLQNPIERRIWRGKKQPDRGGDGGEEFAIAIQSHFDPGGDTTLVIGVDEVWRENEVQLRGHRIFPRCFRKGRPIRADGDSFLFR